MRPIARREMWLGKLVFVVLAVQGPWLLSDVVQGMANGFSLSSSFTAALACAVLVFFAMTLPVLAFAALTSTTTEALIGAVGVLALVIASLIIPALLRMEDPTQLNGYAWVHTLMREVLMLATAIGVFVLQYRSRRAWSARILFAGMLAVGQYFAFLPWSVPFRVGQMLMAESTDDHRIAIAFSPAAGRFRPAPGQGLDDVAEKPGFGSEDVAEEVARRRAEGARTLFLPIQLSGLIPDSRLLADRAEVKMTRHDRVVVYKGAMDEVELRPSAEKATTHQRIRVPGTVYSKVQTEPLDVELDYWFTLFQPDAMYALPARGGTQRMPGVGSCATKVDDGQTRVLFQCLQPGERPSCLSVVLEHPPTGNRNPEVSLCAPDYSPYRGHVLPDAIARFGGRLPFYDPSGLVHYPVGGPQLSEARVIVTSFRPTGHFMKRILIPAVHLQDWEPDTSANAGSSR